MSSPQPTKTLLQSKTFWFAVLTALLGAAQSLQGAHVVDPNTALVAVGVITALLRLVTTKPVTLT